MDTWITPKRVKTSSGFVLVEVLLSMTILVITGTALLRSIQNSIGAARHARDIAKEVFLANVKLHEYEVTYYEKPMAPLGQFEGRYDIPGAEDFHWTAVVDHDPTRDAYVITVWSAKDSRNPITTRRGRRMSAGPDGFMLRTLVPTARYNEYLVRGLPSGRRGESGSRRGR